MKIRIFVAAAAIALSSQASFAATDTSCNPFARSENCNGQLSLGAFPGGLSIGEARFRHTRGQAVSFGIDSFATDRGLQRLGRMMRRLARAIEGGNAGGAPRILAFVPNQSDLFDGEAEPTGNGEVAETAGEGTGGEGLTAVPVPAAGFLLLAGLGGLVAVRRKQS